MGEDSGTFHGDCLDFGIVLCEMECLNNGVDKKWLCHCYLLVFGKVEVYTEEVVDWTFNGEFQSCLF